MNSKSISKLGVSGFLLLAIYLLVAQAGQTEAGQNKLIFSGIDGAVNSEISIRILKEAYPKLAIQPTFWLLPGKRALKMSNSGRVDGELFRIGNVEKKFKNLRPVPTPINYLQAIVFTKSIKFKVDGWQSLKKYRIGIQAGIRFSDRGTQGMNRIVVDTNEQLFKMLSAGRVDIVVVAYTNGIKALKATKVKGVYPLSPPVEEYPLYHYVHVKHSKLIPKLDIIFKQMQSKGRLKAIRTQVINELKEN